VHDAERGLLFASGVVYDKSGNITAREGSQWGSDRYRY